MQGNAVQLVRGERVWALGPWPDVRATLSRSGLCAVVVEGGGLGAPARRLSLLDLSRGETVDVALDPSGVALLAY